MTGRPVSLQQVFCQQLQSVCVCANLNILLSLLSLKFKLDPQKGSKVDKGENLSAPDHGGETILGHHVRERESVCCLRSCVLS